MKEIRYTILYCVNIFVIPFYYGSGMYLGSSFGSATLKIVYHTVPIIFFGKYANEFLITCNRNGVLPAVILLIRNSKNINISEEPQNILF
jgi:hypothetical protein